MENIIISFFKVESEAYQALSELKKVSLYANRNVFSQVGLLKKSDGKIMLEDGFDTGNRTKDDTWKASLIGGVVGILGGPVGVLLGLGVGAVIGSIKDDSDQLEEERLIFTTATRMQDGDVAIIALVHEEREDTYDRVMEPFNQVTLRYDASVIHEEVDHARELEKSLQKQAREQMSERRTAERNEKIKEYKLKLKEKLNGVK